MENKFVRWHVHSVGSTRDGMITIKDMVKEAKKANELVSLTDHGSITMIIEYLNECNKQELLPICGMEAYVNNHKIRLKELSSLIADESDADIKKNMQMERDSKKYNAHLVIVAKNNHGLMNLIKLNNYGYVDGFYNKPLITYNELFSLPKDSSGDRGLIISSACLGGTIPHLILEAIATKTNGPLLEAEDFIRTMVDEFGDDFYLEVQSNDIPEQKQVNKVILKLAKKLNIKTVIGMDSHYLTQKSSDTHQDLLLIQDKKLRADVGKIDYKIVWENKKGEKKNKKCPPGTDFRKGHKVEDVKPGDVFGKGKNAETILSVEQIQRVWTFSTDKVFFKSESELIKEIKKYHKELVPDLDWLIECTKDIGTKITPVSFDSIIKLPTILKADEQLTTKVKQALKSQGLVTKEYVERVKIELERIRENGFCEYFLILADIMDYAKDQDIPLGAGRGSAGGSLVAFLLGIHRMDPLNPAWGGNCNFERFLSEDRNSRRIIVKDAKGNKQEFKELDIIEVTRAGKTLKIKAIDIAQNDVITAINHC